MTEILKSWKSCSSKSDASQTADSTSASGVALPYLSMIRLSSEPALTPIRIEVPRSLAALRDLLDLVVELADVARVDAYGGAAGVDGREDVLGLEVDVGDDRDLRVLGDLGERVGVVLARAGHPHDVAAGGRELGDLLEGALTSEVSVVVIDCTEIGLSLPTPTEPTLIWRVGRLGHRTGGGRAGMPRPTEVMGPSLLGTSGAAQTCRWRGTTRSPTISTTPMTSIAAPTTYAIGSSLATST